MRHLLRTTLLGSLALVGCSALPGGGDDKPLVETSQGHARPLGTAPSEPGPRVPLDPPSLPPPPLDPSPDVSVLGPGSLYVSNRSSGGVMIFDVATKTAVGGFDTVGNSYVAASPDRLSVYVATGQLGTVTKVDTATKAKVATLTVASTVGGIIVSPDSALIYVPQQGGLLHSTSAALTGGVSTESLTNGSNPSDMAWSADGKRLFIGDGNASRVFVRSSGGATSALALPTASNLNGIGQISAMPSLGLVFAPNMLADTVTAFADVGTTYANAGSTVGAGDMPAFAAAHRTRPVVYVTSPKTNTLTVMNVAIVNGAPELSVAKTIPNICKGPSGVTFSGTQAKAFVVCNGAVVIVDSTTDTMIDHFLAPDGLFEVVWSR